MALIPNNGWETGTAGGWTLTAGSLGGESSVVTTDPRSGLYHLNLFKAAAGGQSYAQVDFSDTIIRAKVCVFTVYGKAVSNPTTDLQLQVTYLGSATGATTVTFTNADNGGVYKSHAVTSVAVPSDATGVRFTVGTSSGGSGRWRVDDMQVQVQDVGGNVLYKGGAGGAGIAVYGVEVDWNNDTDFNDSGDAISADVLALSWSRGREAELERAATGVLELRLRNDTGKYSPENGSSALSPNVTVGRRIRVTAVFAETLYTLFRGYIEKIVPHPEPDRQDCYVYCTDGMDRLARRSINAPSGGMFVDKKIGDAAGPLVEILDQAGWPAADRTLDAGIDTLDLWWSHLEAALDAIDKLADAENAFMYVDETGKFVYEDRHHRLKGAHLTSQATFTDTMEEMDYEFSSRTVRNVVQVVGHRRIEGVQAYIWGIRVSNAAGVVNSHISLEPGQTFDVWARFSKPVTGLVAPVSTTDWRAFSGADGTGTNYTANVTLTMTAYGQSAKLALTNNAAAKVYITPGTFFADDTLRIQGKEYDDDPVFADVEDATSIAKHGERAVRIETEFKGKWNNLYDYATWLLNRYKDPQADVVAMKLANATAALLTQILTRKISDRITITATDLGISAKAYFINRMEHRVSNGGQRHEVVYQLAKASEEAFWALGQTGFSELGQTTKLAF